MTMEKHILDELYDVLEARKTADPSESYVAKLYEKGSKKIAKKLGEEAVELVIEAMRYEKKPNGEKAHKRFVGEAADLMFHYLVLMAHHDVKLEEVFDELRARLGVSGFDEKAARAEGEE